MQGGISDQIGWTIKQFSWTCRVVCVCVYMCACVRVSSFYTGGERSNLVTTLSATTYYMLRFVCVCVCLEDQ